MTPGTIGRQVQLLANYYKITTADVVVVHYDVEITKAENERFAKKAPPAGGKPKTEAEAAAAAEEAEEANKAFVRFLARCSNDIIKALVAANQAIFSKDLQYVWDGQRNLYTTKLLKLSGGGGDEQVFNNLKVDIPGGRPGFFKLKVKRVDRVDLSEVTSFYNKKTGDISERVLSIFEMVFRFMCTGPYESYQRKFFDMSTRRPLGFKVNTNRIEWRFCLFTGTVTLRFCFPFAGAPGRLRQRLHQLSANDRIRPRPQRPPEDRRPDHQVLHHAAGDGGQPGRCPRPRPPRPAD